VLRGKLGVTKVGILTITDEEFNAARRIFNTQHNIPGSPYFVAGAAPSGQYELVVRQASDRTNTPAFRATAALIEDLRPIYIFLVGTAGGVLKDVAEGAGRDDTRLGDVITADFIDYTEFVKLRGRKSLARKVPHDHPSMYLRENFAQPLRATTEWHSWIGEPRPPDDPAAPKVVVGNIAAGEKILSSPGSTYQKHLVARFDKALAFETESFGVAHQVFCARSSVHYNPQFLVIRGISDFVNTPESDATRQNWTPYAASAALAFTRYVVEKLLLNFATEPQTLSNAPRRPLAQRLMESLRRKFRRG
jgi:nucleoside phosphorylase